MTKRMMLALALLLMTGAAGAEMLCERWGGEGKGLAHPRTMTIGRARRGQPAKILFDLSALPKGAKVYHASLHCAARRNVQPTAPVRIAAIKDDRGTPSQKPLALEAPWYRSFDVTGPVQQWAKNPETNRGFAVQRFDNWDSRRTFLEIRYEGKSRKLPKPVTGLRAVHHDGQTFLIWKELPLFRPDPAKVFWVGKFDSTKTKQLAEPGKGFGGHPRTPAVTLKTLRDLAGLSVRGKKGPRSMQPIRVIKNLPLIRYRIYRSRRPITAATLKDAQLVGEAKPLCALVARMLIIITHGEYYDPYEFADSVIPTWYYADKRPVMPGEAFYVYTPRERGRFYYAVTVMKNGRESALSLAAGNSLAKPVEEIPETPKPVLQYIAPNRRNRTGLEYHYAYWLAPPVANVAKQDPLRVVVGMMPGLKEPAGLVVRPTAGGMFFGGGVTPGSVHLTIEQDISYGSDLGYSQGRGTLRSFAESKVDFYSERYIMANVRWAMSKWRIDRARITCRANTHFAVRHGDLFRNLFLGPFELDMDRKWNPGSGSLSSLFGPAETARTIDGHLAWNVVSIPWFLKRDPGRDIPFMACLFTQPRDGNHGAEYGWQDDPKGLAALRDARQPFLMQWGGAGIAREVRNGLNRLRWDKSVPAFSNCSLDNNPGNGDPADGDPWGQINGYLFWQYDDIVDAKDRWEMTVYLVPNCPENACTVDVTPRQCRTFRPRPGDTFKWSNTSLADKKVVQSGTVTADKWGLVTLKGLAVMKGRDRIVLHR